MSALTDAMNEYAQAIRGDWSMFDGRSERDVIESWVAEIESPNEAHTLDWWRDRLGICWDGNGHWAGTKWGHCDATRCPRNQAREDENRANVTARLAATKTARIT